MAGCAVAGAAVWSLPMLAAGLVALLRYGLGSLFVVGESVAVALLSGTGADIGGTVQRLQADPLTGLMQAGLGLALACGGAGLAFQNLAVATGLTAASAAWAWHCGLPVAAWLLGAGCVAGLAGCMAARP